jgi:hypothetical protein
LADVAARKKRKSSSAGILASVGWLLALASLLCFAGAKPEELGMFDRMIATGRTAQPWDRGLLAAAMGFAVFATVMGFSAGLVTLSSGASKDNLLLPGLLAVASGVGVAVIASILV